MERNSGFVLKKEESDQAIAKRH